MESIQGVAGQRAILPCNIQPREPNDAVTMVLWFKKDSGDPLYRLIFRNELSKNGLNKKLEASSKRKISALNVK
ncbi:nephrin-like [Vespula maculifrons]|uniref:Nephrin-like n=1 Tax=Vespula maculifrons TaxID=7453 RepID=A0ABD2CDV8_VESMC